MYTGLRPVLTALLLQSELIPRGTRTFVFQQIFAVFLVLGTLVGIVVISYMLYTAYTYRDGENRPDDGFDPPKLGELPGGGGGGRKLVTSFTLSVVIVISLIAWTYGTLLFVEEGPSAEESMEVQVEGYQFGWEFTYENGHTTDGVLRVPAGEAVRLRVTSADVFHNFGVPELKVKTDAIPGHRTDTWFVANETGNYTAQCYELCGAGHSYMTAEVVVMEPDEYRAWYANTSNSSSSS
ncbi:cytochrome c oxidase subunit II [Haloprofundus salilacus]|uniref:cytochrome c oxidase subunit II n=1 Tax=Haloprofundus salilacus TaxID=2876190 RepID=UPI001CCED87F|nr:cytochrome c oxidase subunit II [Haloprofundus salilacus]